MTGVRRASGAGGTGSGTGAGGLEVELADGETVAADVVVVGIGVAPSTGWLEGSGLEVGNGVICDHGLFAADGIVAAGDVARWEWRHDDGEELIRIEHWQVAAEAGVAAARSLLAGRADAPAFSPVPYFWSDQFGIRFQVLGNPVGRGRRGDHRRVARGGKVRCRLRPSRPTARRHGHRQAAPAHGVSTAPAVGVQLRRRAGSRRGLRRHPAPRGSPERGIRADGAPRHDGRGLEKRSGNEKLALMVGASLHSPQGQSCSRSGRRAVEHHTEAS